MLDSNDRMAVIGSSESSHPRWLGGAAASMAVCITHPIDQTKVRTQTQAVRQGMLTTARNTISNEGVFGLWTGLTGSLLRQATYGAARFGVYAELNSRDAIDQEARGESGPLPKSLKFRNGAIAGVVAGLIGAPGELVMVRMCADGVKPASDRVHYRNALQGLYRIYKDEGVRFMFRGGSATVLRSVLMNGTQLACYDIIKEKLLTTGYFADNVPLHMVTAITGGTISVTVCAPVDVMKSRIQSSKGLGSPLRIVTRSLRQEGPTLLFRGWLPAWLRMTPTTALTFVFMEQLKKLF